MPRTSTSASSRGLKMYSIGYVLSLILTIMPFLMVYYQTVSGARLVGAIIVFALLQLLVQLIFFLHLGRPGGKWNIMAFLFMGIVVLIIVVGSLWIMSNISYRMSPQEVETYLLEEENIKR